MESLTSRAERAALGAMLSDPAMAARLGHLRQRDFADSRHREVLTAIQVAAREPAMTAARWASAVAAHVGPMATRQLIADLAAACPVPAHGPAYAALVIEASLCRQLAAHGRQLTARADVLGGDARRAAEAAGGSPQAAGLVSHMRQLGDTLTRHAAQVTAPAAVADHQTVARPQPALGNREEAVLSALLTRHRESGQVLEFLPSAAFTDDYRQELFRAVRALVTAGQPVDPLTADWELARRGVPVVGSGGSYAEALATAAATGESPVRAATILLAQLHRVAGRGQDPGTSWGNAPAVPAPRYPGPRLRLVQQPPGPPAPAPAPDKGSEPR